MALLNLRTTPVDNRLPSPAEMLLGRQVASILPTRQTNIDQEVKDQLEGRGERAKEHYDANDAIHSFSPYTFYGQLYWVDQLTKMYI